MQYIVYSPPPRTTIVSPLVYHYILYYSFCFTLTIKYNNYNALGKLTLGFFFFFLRVI